MITEHNFYTGGIPSPEDKRDIKMSDIAMSPVPFDWDTGYDVLATYGITLTTKNQQQSYSCGGQAFSYYGEVLSTIFDKVYNRKSARFPYAQVFLTGGGSDGRSLCDIFVKQGWADEIVLSSYLPDGTCTEQFMEISSDINDSVRLNAAKDKAFTYATTSLDFDSIAQAIRDNHGVVLGVVGSNNGTWSGEYPLPAASGSEWNHWIYFYAAKMVNGVKMLRCINSWGNSVGKNGHQWIREGQKLFESRTVVYNTPPSSFTHNFQTNLWQGQSSDEVTALQTALQVDGCFPKGIAPTGYYGNITTQSVAKFQTKYKVANPVILWANGGRFVGEATRKALNDLFNK